MPALNPALRTKLMAFRVLSSEAAIAVFFFFLRAHSRFKGLELRVWGFGVLVFTF